MDVKELKKLIETKGEIPYPLILKCLTNTTISPSSGKAYPMMDNYLALQYAKAITEDCDVTYIDSVSAIQLDNSFFDTPSYYIYIVDELAEDVTGYDNLIVIYRDIAKDKKTKEPLITEPEHIDMPKLTEWQVQDYVKMRLPGMMNKDIEWLCKQAKYDIYRLSLECDKIGIFKGDDQQLVFEQIRKEHGYDDITEFNVFDFINAWEDRNWCLMMQLMKQAEVVDLEPTGIVTLAKRKVKKFMDLQMNPNAKPADLGMSEKQFWYLKSHKKFSNQQLIELYDALTGIDYRIKSGNLDIRTDASEIIDSKMLTYVVCKMLSC